MILKLSHKNALAACRSLWEEQGKWPSKKLIASCPLKPGAVRGHCELLLMWFDLPRGLSRAGASEGRCHGQKPVFAHFKRPFPSQVSPILGGLLRPRLFAARRAAPGSFPGHGQGVGVGGGVGDLGRFWGGTSARRDPAPTCGGGGRRAARPRPSARAHPRPPQRHCGGRGFLPYMVMAALAAAGRRRADWRGRGRGKCAAR